MGAAGRFPATVVREREKERKGERREKKKGRERREKKEMSFGFKFLVYIVDQLS